MKLLASIVGLAVIALVLGLSSADAQIDALQSAMSRLEVEEAHTNAEIAQLAAIAQRLRSADSGASQRRARLAHARAKVMQRLRDTQGKDGGWRDGPHTVEDSDSAVRAKVMQRLMDAAGGKDGGWRAEPGTVGDDDSAVRAKVMQRLMDAGDKDGGWRDGPHTVEDRDSRAKLYQRIADAVNTGTEGGKGGGWSVNPGLMEDRDSRVKLYQRIADAYDSGAEGGKGGGWSHTTLGDRDARAKVLQRIVADAGGKDGGWRRMAGPAGDATEPKETKSLLGDLDNETRAKLIQRLADADNKNGGFHPAPTPGPDM